MPTYESGLRVERQESSLADVKKKVLVTGHPGQLSTALKTGSGARSDWMFVTKSELDVTDRNAVRAIINDYPLEAVINTAAYTQVDLAETEDVDAGRINADAPGFMAEACLEANVRMLHVSTDFVFDGSASRPISPDTPVSPISTYGRTKAEGEKRVRDILGSEALIVRTAWLYSAGPTNFLAAMLRLMSTRDRIGVVDDQIGSPTWACTLAVAISDLIECDATGTYHVTDSGVASWFDFAVAIQEMALESGILSTPVRIEPISTSDYPTAATRPAYSVLDKASTNATLGRCAPHWRLSLRRCIESIDGGGATKTIERYS